MTTNVNESFENFILRRNHFLYRVENGTIQEMVAPYRAAKQDLYKALTAAQLEVPGASREWKIARLSSQIAETEAILRAAALESAGKLEEALQSLAITDSDAYYNMLQSKFSNIGININQLPYKQIDYIISNPLLGESIGEKLLWENKKVIRNINQELTQSIILGEDMGQAAKRLINPLTTGMTGAAERAIANRAAMIARTEIQHISNQVSRGIYRENQDVLKGVKFLGTLDSRTCIQCGNLDGQVYEYKGREDHNGPLPPLHPHCRCCYSPITYSWKELGSKIPEHIDKNSKMPFTGEAGDKMTYSKWLTNLNKTDPDAVKDILGATRYKLWESGKIKFSQMATSKKTLTLKELEKKFK